MAALEPNQELFDHYARAARASAACASRCARTTCASGRRAGARCCRSTSCSRSSSTRRSSGTRKPEPEIYAITLERLGLPAEACVFVDDLEPNVDAAKTAGMRGIVHRDTAQTIAELESLL